MKSILAQFEYTNIVKQYDKQGVPFRTYLYVPETHPETGEVFYEREDDAHLLKVFFICQLSNVMYIENSQPYQKWWS